MGATHFDPAAFSRLLGMDRTPEAATIRRKYRELAEAKKTSLLLEALGRHHLETLAPSVCPFSCGVDS